MKAAWTNATCPKAKRGVGARTRSLNSPHDIQSTAELALKHISSLDSVTASPNTTPAPYYPTYTIGPIDYTHYNTYPYHIQSIAMFRRIAAVVPAQAGRVLSTGARPSIASPIRAAAPATLSANGRRQYHEKDKYSFSAMHMSQCP